MKTVQLELDFAAAEKNKINGMIVSELNAEAHCEGWASEALFWLGCFLKERSTPFMTEEVREYAHLNGLPDPKNNRAWGGIIARARGMRWIKFVTLGRTSNPKAHRANAAVWQRA